MNLIVTQTSRRFGIAEDASRIASSIISRNLSPNPKQAKKDDAKLAAPTKDKKAVVRFCHCCTVYNNNCLMPFIRVIPGELVPELSEAST